MKYNSVHTLLLVCLSLSSCTGDAIETAPLTIIVSDSTGKPLADFTLFMADRTGTTIRINCSESGMRNPDCAGNTATAMVQDGVISVTVKASGYGTASAQHQTGSKPAGNNGFPDLKVTLKVLPEPTMTNDYATGFKADNPPDFTSLAAHFNTELGPADVVKFYIHNVQTDNPEVYFQNTAKHPIHYAFVNTVLGLNLTFHEFGLQTYYGEDRVGMAGSLLHYTQLEALNQITGETFTAPLLLTFFPSDGLTPGMARLAHRLLEERIQFLDFTGAARRLLYLPAGSGQEAELLARTGPFAAEGVGWLAHTDLYTGIEAQYLNPATSFGILRLVRPEEMATRVLSYTDIVVLPRLPNELPLVGGTITDEFQTPLAHVNVAARNRGTPNLALPGASQNPDLIALLDLPVRFTVASSGYELVQVSEEEVASFWEDRQVTPVIPEFSLENTGLPDFTQLSFGDSLTVGAKAANLAELYGLLGEHAPHGFAVPFFHYQQFLESRLVTTRLCELAAQDCLEEGRLPPPCIAAYELCGAGAEAETLQQFIARLITDAGFRTDTMLREAALDGLRTIIRNSEPLPDFITTTEEQARLSFGLHKLRLRSSTNAEDLPFFSGAGLYSSTAALPAGPKGPGSRILRVWASAWNWRAFEERSFWGIDHSAIKMGVAVTPSYPFEQANGVLITQNIADLTVAGMYVNVQLGEVPVTNPEGGANPEIFSILPGPLGAVQVARQRFSSLSPDKPILADEEIDSLFVEAGKIQTHFAGLYGKDPYALALDLEFKFHGPDRKLIIKQVRPYVQSGAMVP